MASAALTRALQTAERARDAEHQSRALWGLIAYRTYIGDHRKAPWTNGKVSHHRR
jgi:hypothetical protein